MAFEILLGIAVLNTLFKTHRSGSGDRNGNVEVTDNSCATACCRLELAFLRGSDGTGCQHSGSTRSPNNSVGK